MSGRGALLGASVVCCVGLLCTGRQNDTVVAISEKMESAHVVKVISQQITASGSGEKDHSSKRPIAVSVGGTIELGSKSNRVLLRGVGSGKSDLPSQVKTLESGKHIYLVLEGLSATAQPGVLFHIYIDLPESEMPTENDVRHVGVLNFFGAVGPVPSESNSVSQHMRSYDLTDTLRKLLRSNLLTDTISVTIIPSRNPAANAKATLTRIELIRQ